MPATISTKLGDVVVRSTRFRVPDDDDEIDSSSESSREASVEILNSHVRAYSVPSSEDSASTSDDEEDLSILNDILLSKPTTTAVIAAARPANTAGTTPHDALEIVESEPYSSKEPELLRPYESESFNSSNIQMNGSGSLRLRPTVDEDDLYSLVSDIEDELPEVLSSKRTIAGSAPHVPASSSTQAANSPYLPGGSPIEPDARNAAVTRDVVENHENPEKSMMESPCTNPQFEFNGITYSLATGVEFTPLAKNTAKNSRTTSMNKSDYPRLATDCKTMTESDEKDFAHKASVPRRPPSPSDAALVKKAKFVDQRSFWPVMEQNQSQSLIEMPSEYETQFNDAQFNETQCNETQLNETRGMGEADYPHVNFTKESHFYSEFASTSWPFPHLRPVHGSQVHGSTTEPAPSGLPETASSKSTVQSHPVEPTLFAPCNLRSHTQSWNPLLPSDDQDSSIFGLHQFQSKEHGNPSSRLNISDIVHPPLESSRNLKRKADEMSVDDAEVVPCVLPSESSQEVLTDAQPRDVTSADEAILIEESSNIPVNGGISVQRPSVSGSPEPPRKKVKTSVSTAIGIGKFVSGVCFGVAGVFAAFIATIPLSVREEAMQELVSST